MHLLFLQLVIIFVCQVNKKVNSFPTNQVQIFDDEDDLKHHLTTLVT